MSGQSATGGGLSRPQLRALQSDLMGAQDAQVLKVVAMVDRLPVRGEADAFIAPLRPRLAALRPQRAVNFARLLFTPMNMLIVQPTEWRRDAIALPRSALRPLAGQVRAALGEDAAAFDRRMAGLSSGQEEEIRAIGATLWPRAADILSGCTPAESWAADTGLTAEDHRAIAGLAAKVLARSGAIEALSWAAMHGKPPAQHEIEALLALSLEGGTTAFSAIAALLAVRLPHARPVFIAADDIAARRAEPALRLAVDQMIDTTIDGIEANIAETVQLAQAAASLRSVVGLLEDLELQCTTRPSRKARIVQLRRTIDASSREKFTEAMDLRLLRPAATLAEADDREAEELEAAARDLRRFEGVARRLGGAEHYDGSLRAAAAALKPRSGEPLQTIIDRVRLIEILQGSEAAAAAMPS